jgi:hypothetical protein
MTKKELESCLKWISDNKENNPILKYKVYGKKFPKNEKAPKMGLKLYEIYGKGDLSLWSDAILFVSQPPKGWKKTIFSRVTNYLQDETPEGIGDAILEFSSSLIGNSKDEFIENLSNEYSLFIPIKNIDNIDGGKGLFSLFFGNSLDIYFKDLDDNEVHSYFFGNKEMRFPSFSFRKEIDKIR